MNRILALALALSALSGCIYRYEVTHGQEQGHYVVTRTGNSGRAQVYDCYSKPEEAAWDPTCVQVDFQKAPPGSSEAR